MEMPSAKVFLLIYLTEQTAATVALNFGMVLSLKVAQLVTTSYFTAQNELHYNFSCIVMGLQGQYMLPLAIPCVRYHVIEFILFLIYSAFKNTVIYYERKALYYNHQVFRQYFIVKLTHLN